MSLVSRCRGALLGLAVGDAVGTTVEFCPRGSFPRVTDMTGGGPFRLPVGAWTDDTSMALALGHSLANCQGFDPVDQMNRYCDWWLKGDYSSTGQCFDIGNTTRQALSNFSQTGEPFSGSTDPRSSGNGCLMRLAPVPIAYHRDMASARHYARESSRTTHGSLVCLETSQLLAEMVVGAIQGQNRDQILFSSDAGQYQSEDVRSIAAGEYRFKDYEQIRGSGYAAACLEAAAWCFWHADDFRDAVLLAVNLGDDADTTGAVVGQLAGAYFGEEGIPTEWLDKLVQRDEITHLADRLANLNPPLHAS